MRKAVITSKISIKLLFVTVLCLFLALSACYLFTDFIIIRYELNREENINALVTLISAIGISVYISSYLLIVNRKIKYIKYIAARVKKISNKELGSSIEIRGNDELAELCTSINDMSKELKYRREKEKEIEDAKNELITNVSHDLRTPLTSIIGYVDLLRRKEYKNEDQLGQYIDVIYHKSQDLQTLINELFEYTKLTTPGIKINRSRVELGGLLEQLVGEYTPIFGKEGLTIKRDIPAQDIYVEVDIEKIVRVFENILMNAMKYSTGPSDIYVKLKYARLYEQMNAVVVSISNRTDKIRMENLDMLFEKFYRADTARKDSDGAGLGLAIAKKIVELHEGKIWAEYKDGFISFIVELYAPSYCG